MNQTPGLVYMHSGYMCKITDNIWKIYFFLMFLRCRDNVLLSTCPFSIFRFHVLMVFIYIYIYSQGFIWILFWNMQRCKLIILLSSSNLVIVVFFEYWFSNSWVLVLDVQFDDNSSSTSSLVEI